jgi:hypothetical protein
MSRTKAAGATSPHTLAKNARMGTLGNGGAGDHDKEDALVVAVMRDGFIFLGKDRIRPAELSVKIREGLSRGAEK